MTQPQAKKQLASTLSPDPFDLDDIALLLDIDGTLLDIAARPEEVRVPEWLPDTLQRLWRRLDGALAFVSGRPLADIDRIFAPVKLPAVGGHGAEIRFKPDDANPVRHSRPLDKTLKKLFAEIGAIGPGIVVEDKNYSLALHYRLAPQLAGTIIKSVTAICEKHNCDAVEILPGKAVIEIKPRGFDKGSGLRELMMSPPFAGRQPVFIGDDITDAKAFAVLPEFSGIGISVGGIVAGATYNLDGPEDVRAWIRQIAGDIRAEA